MSQPANYDFHIHSDALPHHSSWHADALVRHALELGLRAIAVTDHNTLAGVDAALVAGARHGLAVISGVEFDSGFPHGGVAGTPLRLWHTLVYGADPHDAGLLALCAVVLARNVEDAARLRELLAAQNVVLEGLDNFGRPPNVADVATALARSGAPIGRVAGETDEAAGMRHVLHHMAGGYTPPSVAEVIDAAHAAGGVAVLAHPGRANGIYAVPADESDIAALAKIGLDGIEVFYPAHSMARRRFLLNQAERYGLLVTGGSDSHHPDQPLASWDHPSLSTFVRRLGIS